ncbi:hypothetical protein TraAM80_06639 [Trypanosoma rangeli]|uniref:Uncharacterized protein n=1 Tax=Trypanosoma rangeli TaxID=5698 RepID=A0A3R7KV72_TRYRA|nr:uncharacterized protein TraAM80_06639 [Trypanosoma rangeli]RNF02024.1 hypothetical protein TraAM80_06639 [Trypanosoma rangeli]|eukprot:RNF02024.1 hypothetical protein TraAM80_06639 [Trypanosoma rangeli]
MPHSHALLQRRSGVSSYRVRSPGAATSVDKMHSFASGACPNKRRRRSPGALALDVPSLGPSEDGATATATPVTGAGVFVAPNPILATLSTSEWLMSSRVHLADPALRSSMERPLLGVVVTAEVGGWLRVREQRNGTIHYQRRLRSRCNPLCLCWSLASCCTFFVGQQCGLVTMLQLQHESIIEVADCVLHEAAVVAMTRVFVHTRGNTVAAEKTSGMAQELLLTLDANGVLGVWKTAGPYCMQKVQLLHPPFRCLTSDESLPGGIFVPGGVEGALAADGGAGGSRGGVFDVALLECPYEVGAAWRRRVTYGGTRAAVISMALAPRPSSAPAGTTLTLWGGTENGALHMWDVASGAPLRVLHEVTPSCAPIHYLHCVPCIDPRHVWVCTRGGSVMLWDAGRLMLLSELSVSYPKGPAVDTPHSSPRHPHCGGGETDANTCFLQHLLSDASEAPTHFTLFVRPIEPVLTLRLWSAATDGTVRSWLCQTSLSEVSLGATPASSVGRNPDVIAMETVRAFIEGKARLFAEETDALRRDVAQLTRESAALQARNRVLADALRAATTRIACQHDEGDVANRRPSVESPQPREPPLSSLGDSPHISSMRAALEDLRRRLQDASSENERLSAEKMVLRLRLAEQPSKLELAQGGGAALLPSALQPAVVAGEEQMTLERLQEEVAACQATSEEYMHHWRREQTRREAAEKECEVCKRRLRTLEDELSCAKAQLLVCTAGAAARVQNTTHQTAEDGDVDGGRPLEKPAFSCGALSGRRDAVIDGAATQNLESAWRELHRREQRLAAAQDMVQDKWSDIQQSRVEVDAEAAELRHAQQRLVEREAGLLEHAERLCALEEELRRRERCLFQRRSRSR